MVHAYEKNQDLFGIFNIGSKDYIDVTKPVHLMVHYSESIEDGEELKSMVTSRYNCMELYMTELTPVMSCHTGPMCGLSFYS